MPCSLGETKGVSNKCSGGTPPTDDADRFSFVDSERKASDPSWFSPSRPGCGCSSRRPRLVQPQFHDHWARVAGWRAGRLGGVGPPQGGLPLTGPSTSSQHPSSGRSRSVRNHEFFLAIRREPKRPTRAQPILRTARRSDCGLRGRHALCCRSRHLTCGRFGTLTLTPNPSPNPDESSTSARGRRSVA